VRKKVKHSGQFQAGNKHRMAVDLVKRTQELKAFDIGTLILDGEVHRNEKGYLVILTFCPSCSGRRNIDVSNIMSKKTTNCRCQRSVKYGGDPRAKVLGERYDAIYQRCENFSSPMAKNYGARGIRCLMKREQFIRYMLAEFPHPNYLGVEIDRIDNEGHYIEGNLRLVTCSENLLNRYNTRFFDYHGEEIYTLHLYDRLKKDYPKFKLARSTTYRLAREGCSVDNILSRNPRKN